MEKTVQIYYTSDTHGHIFPVNYAANCSEKSGLLNLADQMEKDGKHPGIGRRGFLAGDAFDPILPGEPGPVACPPGSCGLQCDGSGLLYLG